MYLYRDKEWLKEHYVDKGMTLKEISELLGCSIAPISNYARKYGLERPKEASYNSTLVEVLCHNCKDPFTNSLRHFARRIRRGQFKLYCSHKCATDFQQGKPCPSKGRSGEDSSSWKGGVSGINECLRDAIRLWKREVARSQNYTCYITEKSVNNFHIHHITPFHEIRDIAIAELSIKLKPTLSENMESDIERLKALIVKKHEQEQGYVVTAELHQLFHNIYGYKTTEIDFEEFKTRYQSGEFNAILTQKEAS